VCITGVGGREGAGHSLPRHLAQLRAMRQAHDERHVGGGGRGSHHHGVQPRPLLLLKHPTPHTQHSTPEGGGKASPSQQHRSSFAVAHGCHCSHPQTWAATPLSLHSNAWCSNGAGAYLQGVHEEVQETRERQGCASSPASLLSSRIRYWNLWRPNVVLMALCYTEAEPRPRGRASRGKRASALAQSGKSPSERC